MKKFLKWTASALVLVALAGFLAFLYFIPPFTTAPPEAFSKPEADAAPSLDHIKDPTTHLLAERGKRIVQHAGCAGCHVPGGPQGPKFDAYLAGGLKFDWRIAGTVVSRNLTPDPETGLGNRTDDEIKRVLRSGLLKEGRVMHPTNMPWTAWSNWTEEDRHAVVVYLRNIKPIRHKIPEITPSDSPYFSAYGGIDYALPDKD